MHVVACIYEECNFLFLLENKNYDFFLNKNVSINS
jgi:hypothetical protein